MKVGVIGFGKTGKAVASILLESKQTNLQWVIRRSTSLQQSVPDFFGVVSDEPGLIFSKNDFTAANLFDNFPVDAVVDFSSESGIFYYGEEAAKRGIMIISAVSKYPKDVIDMLNKLSQKTIVLYSPNITLGINFILIASKILQSIAPNADIEIIEEHFNKKREVSGTACVISDKLNLNRSDIKSIRAGGIVGVHEVLFGFPYQTVRLRHESIAREAFGNGILFAIRNLHGKTFGLYTMEDLMLPYFREIKM